MTSKEEHKTKVGQLYVGVDVKSCNKCEYKNNRDIRDMLLVTSGARAAFMHRNNVIDIPDVVKHGDDLARFITRAVDEYMEQGHGDFDIWIRECLIKAYGTNERPWREDAK